MSEAAAAAGSVFVAIFFPQFSPDSPSSPYPVFHRSGMQAYFFSQVSVLLLVVVGKERPVRKTAHSRHLLSALFSQCGCLKSHFFARKNVIFMGKWK